MYQQRKRTVDRGWMIEALNSEPSFLCKLCKTSLCTWPDMHKVWNLRCTATPIRYKLDVSVMSFKANKLTFFWYSLSDCLQGYPKGEWNPKRRKCKCWCSNQPLWLLNWCSNENSKGVSIGPIEGQIEKVKWPVAESQYRLVCTLFTTGCSGVSWDTRLHHFF